MDVMEGLQLLPGTKKRLGIKVPGENRFLYIGSAILGAVIVISFGLNFSTNALKNELKSLDEQILVLDQSRNKQSESVIRVIQSQLALTNELVDKHLYFSQSILKLSSLISETIRLEALSLDSEGVLSITGFAAGYTIIAKQVGAFMADDSVADLTIGKMDSQPDGTIKFGMQIKFDKVKLLQKEK